MRRTGRREQGATTVSGCIGQRYAILTLSGKNYPIPLRFAFCTHAPNTHLCNRLHPEDRLVLHVHSQRRERTSPPAATPLGCKSGYGKEQNHESP